MRRKVYALVKGAVAAAVVGVAVYSGGWFLYEVLEVGEWLSFSGTQSLLLACVGLQAALFLGLGFREYRKLQDGEPERVAESSTTEPAEALTRTQERLEKLEGEVAEVRGVLKLEPKTKRGRRYGA